DGKTVVDGAVVAAKEGKSRILITPVLVHSLLMLIADAQPPIVSKSVFVGGAGHQCVRRVVLRSDQRGCAGAVREIEFVDRSEGVHPAVLRQIVIVHSDSAAEHSPV